MLNIKYRYIYDSREGLFEGVPEKVRNPLQYKLLKKFIFDSTKGIAFYCGNKPFKIIWNVKKYI